MEIFIASFLVFQVFNAIHHVVQFDKAIEARRGAVVVLKLMLEGLGNDALRVLQTLIRDIWRTLIAQRNSEPDEIMQVHIADAIESINKIVRNFLQPEETMTKKIFVLDQPEDPL